MTDFPASSSLFELPGYRVDDLEQADSAVVQGLLEKAADYSILVTGSPPGPSAGDSLLTSLPKGKTLADKVVIGLFTEKHDLIGLLDAVRSYPQEGEWWIGLFIFDPAYRRQELVSRFFRAFKQWAGQLGARRIFLGVVEPNQAAYRFWHRMGFKEVERRPPVQDEIGVHLVIVMVSALDASEK